jgi:hypothetical protein
VSDLASWNDGPTRQAIVEFAETAVRDVPPEERIAVFDNDGTLWCEKPMSIELGFILQRLAEMVEEDSALSELQPWKAACEKDFAWLGGVMERHYAGDDSDSRSCSAASCTRSPAGPSKRMRMQLRRSSRTRGIPRSDVVSATAGTCQWSSSCATSSRTTSTASSPPGGSRDFMRVIAGEIYGIPPERVVGSSNGLRFVADDDGGALEYLAEPDVFDDGPAKPVRIWSRIGRRPLLAAGNSNGDVPMLQYAAGPSRSPLRLLVRHDDAEREFDYTRGADAALARAGHDGWHVVSVKRDWAVVFADGGGL